MAMVSVMIVMVGMCGGAGDGNAYGNGNGDGSDGGDSGNGAIVVVSGDVWLRNVVQ